MLRQDLNENVINQEQLEQALKKIKPKQRSIHRLPIMYMVSVFLLFLYTFFIELSALIDKIKSMRTIADIFAFVDGG